MDDRLAQIRTLQQSLQQDKIDNFNRRVPFGDLVTERHENAQQYGFGEGTTCYDSAVIIGDVKVGKHCWIGPNVVLDGSGGLTIGDYCSISAGVQIYTHHTVAWATSLGECPVEHSGSVIGDGVYIGPSTIIQMGVTVGNRVTIGALSLVNADIPEGSKAWGTPAKVVGRSECYTGATR